MPSVNSDISNYTDNSYSPMDKTITEVILNKLKKEITKNDNMDSINKFNPYRYQTEIEPLTKGLPIVFVTTPKLNLSKKVNLNKVGFFKYMMDVEPELLRLLSFGGDSTGEYLFTGSPFIKVLTNNFKSITLTGVTSRTKEVNETFYGYKQLFPSAMIDSITANELSVTYAEDKNLDIIKLHKAWTDYIELVRRGIFKPSQNTIESRTIDFTCSIYYFLLDFDCSTILYYAKYTGCSPINVPYDVLSSDAPGGSRDLVDLTINYAYCYKEDMNPDILMDFNIIAGSAGKINSTDELTKIMYNSEVDKKVYDGDYFTDEDFTNIISAAVTLENYTDNLEKKRYKLKFLEQTPTATTTFKETDDRDLQDPNSEASLRLKAINKELEDIEKELLANALNPLKVARNAYLTAKKIELTKEIGKLVANDAKQNLEDAADKVKEKIGDTADDILQNLKKAVWK